MDLCCRDTLVPLWSWGRQGAKAGPGPGGHGGRRKKLGGTVSEMLFLEQVLLPKVSTLSRAARFLCT